MSNCKCLQDHFLIRIDDLDLIAESLAHAEAIVLILLQCSYEDLPDHVLSEALDALRDRIETAKRGLDGGEK